MMERNKVHVAHFSVRIRKSKVGQMIEIAMDNCFGPWSPLAPVACTVDLALASENISRFTGCENG